MPPPSNREKQVFAAIGALALIGAAGLAWSTLGGLGITILGLAVLFVAVRVELESDRPAMNQTQPEQYARLIRAQHDSSRSDRAARKAELTAFGSTARLFAVAGTLLALIGIGCLVLGLGGRPPAIAYVFGDIFMTLFQKGKP